MAALTTLRWRVGIIGGVLGVAAATACAALAKPAPKPSEIANLAKTLAPAPENTMSGTSMRLKSCLHLYDSPDAAKKLKRLVK